MATYEATLAHLRLKMNLATIELERLARLAPDADSLAHVGHAGALLTALLGELSDAATIAAGPPADAPDAERDADAVLAGIHPNIVSVSASAMLMRFGLRNTPDNRSILVELLCRHGWNFADGVLVKGGWFRRAAQAVPA